MREVLMYLGQTQIHPSDMMCKQEHFFQTLNVAIILNSCGKMTLALVSMKLSTAVVFGLCEILLFSTTSYSPHILTYTTVTVCYPYNNSNAEMTI
jgi:hypothetical protein